jgi:hypothetical protein
MGLGWYRSRVGTSWTPQALSPAAWYRADLGITIATGVSSWADQSGNARHATQGTGGLQPSLQASYIGGKPGVKFTGSQYLPITLNSLAMNADYTVWLIGQYDSATSGALTTMFGAFDGAATAHTCTLYALNASSGTEWRDKTGQYTMGGVTANQPVLFGIISQAGASNVKYRKDNTTNSGTRTNPTNAINSAYIGADRTVLLGVGTIAEIVILERAASAGEQSSAMAYFSGRYGQSWT